MTLTFCLTILTLFAFVLFTIWLIRWKNPFERVENTIFEDELEKKRLRGEL